MKKNFFKGMKEKWEGLKKSERIGLISVVVLLLVAAGVGTAAGFTGSKAQKDNSKAIVSTQKP